MMLVDKETGKGYVEMEKVHHDKKEYASKGVAGTALGLGIAGTALALFNNGFGGNFFDLVLNINGDNLFVKIGYRHSFYNGRIDNIIYLSYY